MKKIVTVGILFCVFLGNIFTQNDLQVIAQINLIKPEPITLGQLKKFVSLVETESEKTLSVEDRKQVLIGLLNQRLLLQAAEKENIRFSNSEVDTRFNALLSQLAKRPINEAEFAKMLKQQTNLSLDEFLKKQTGKSVSETKEFFKELGMIETYVYSKNRSEIETKAIPTDSDIRRFYEINKQQMVRPDTMKMLVVAVLKEGQDAAEITKIETLHKKLTASLKNLNDIKKNSQTEGYIAQEGYVTKDAIGAQILNTTPETLIEIFSKNINYVSEIQNRSDSRQFFVIIDKIDAKILNLSDVYDPSSTVTVYETVKAHLANELRMAAYQMAVQKTVEELSNEQTYKILKNDAELKKLLAWK